MKGKVVITAYMYIGLYFLNSSVCRYHAQKAIGICIFQLSEPKVVKMKQLLEKAQSSYDAPFKAMLARVDEGECKLV